MYKYKDILFALREEYVKNEEILKRLEALSSTKNKKDRVNFYLDMDCEYDLPELHYELIKKQNILRKALNKLIGVDTSIRGGKFGITCNGDYLGDTQDFEITGDQVLFGEALGEIYDNPFTTEAFNTVIDNNEEQVNLDRKLMIYPDRIITYRRNNTDFVTSVYDSVKDNVRFSNNKGKCTYDNMYGLLDMEFPEDKFSIYLKQVIEGSKLYGLNAFIYDNDDHKKDKDFEPIVEDKRLVLLRK